MDTIPLYSISPKAFLQPPCCITVVFLYFLLTFPFLYAIFFLGDIMKKFKKDEIYQSIDWIQGTIPWVNAYTFFSELANCDKRLKFDNWVKQEKGLLGYSNRYCFEGKNNIVVCWNSTSDYELISNYPNIDPTFLVKQDTEFSAPGKVYFPRIFIYISGDGLRQLGDNQFSVYAFLCEYGFRCTRVDVAIDFFDKENTYVPLLQGAFEATKRCRNGKNDKGEVIRPASAERGTIFIRSAMNRDTIQCHIHDDLLRAWNKEACSYNYEMGGSGSELGRVKLYDKWLEVNTVKRLAKVKEVYLAPVPDDYWYRLEYTIKSSYASDLFSQMYDYYRVNGEWNIPILSKWCVNKFFSLVVFKSAGYHDADLDIADAWKAFVKYFDDITDGSLSFYLAKLPRSKKGSAPRD